MANSNKFKIKFKLQGLELEIEGSREDVPLIGQAVGQQVAALFQPVSDIVEGEVKVLPSPDHTLNQSNGAPTTSKKKRKYNRTSSASTSEKDNTALDWKHNSEEWGSPNQDWTLIQKTLWTMYVAEQAISVKDMSVGSIASTFNKHFRQASTIKSNHVSSALGKSKGKGKEALVGEDTTQQPSKWYLTSKGKENVKSFINGLQNS